MTVPLFAEYIWIDGTTPTAQLRSKTKVLHTDKLPYDAEHSSFFPEWGFDGSSTNQANGSKSDCALKPVAYYPDPIRGEGHFLVLCEVMNADGTPHPTNTRAKLREVLNMDRSITGEMMNCLFGLEQEYTLFKGSRPLGFGEDRRFPAAQGPYYCGVGADEVYGREMVEEHLKLCVDAGVLISGINAEVMPGQWEFQVGPLGPLAVADHLWIARWLLYRVGEKYGIHATLDPKPVPGDWNGAGMHTNFSTPAMMQDDPIQAGIDALTGHDPKGPFGMAAIEAFCEEAGKHIQEHLAAYGDGIEMRLTGKHETCSYREFKWGVSDRTASIRIPMATAQQGHGYLEDRRPNGNADPYKVATVMLKTAFGLW